MKQFLIYWSDIRKHEIINHINNKAYPMVGFGVFAGALYPSNYYSYSCADKIREL